MEEHRPKKLLDHVRDAIRLKHYSYRTEQAYVGWIKRYIYFHDVRHPSEMGAPEVKAFLTHLAVKESVAASTQNQALSAPAVQDPTRIYRFLSISLLIFCLLLDLALADFTRSNRSLSPQVLETVG